MDMLRAQLLHEDHERLRLQLPRFREPVLRDQNLRGVVKRNGGRGIIGTVLLHPDRDQTLSDRQRLLGPAGEAQGKRKRGKARLGGAMVNNRQAAVRT